jgi:hypothetical protein
MSSGWKIKFLGRKWGSSILNPADAAFPKFGPAKDTGGNPVIPFPNGHPQFYVEGDSNHLETT